MTLLFPYADSEIVGALSSGIGKTASGNHKVKREKKIGR